MKTKLLSLAALLVSAATALAAPLTETTAVHTKPDRSSPAVTFLKAGTEPAVVADAVATTPAGWLAVELPGPFEAYVLNKDLTKGLDPNAKMKPSGIDWIGNIPKHWETACLRRVFTSTYSERSKAITRTFRFHHSFVSSRRPTK